MKLSHNYVKLAVMFSPEQLYYEKVLGVRKEHPVNLVAASILVGLSSLYARQTDLKVIGSVPPKGAAIFIFNHLDDLDILRLLFTSTHACRGEDGEKTLGRIPRGLVKSTLFGIPEPDKIKKRTGKKDWLNSNNRFVQILTRLTIGSVLYGNGCIPIIRGTADRIAGAEINTALKDLHEIVGSSIMESRDGTGGLKGLRIGAAQMIRTHPATPFQLVGVSREPHMVNLGERQTYAAIRAERGNLNLKDFSMMLADRIIELLPESIQERWRSGERLAEYQVLYSHKNQAVLQNP